MENRNQATWDSVALAVRRLQNDGVTAPTVEIGETIHRLLALNMLGFLATLPNRWTRYADAILEQLGFQNVATVRKHRSFFLLEDTVISIDDVENVGLFLEFERVVESEDMIASAREVIFKQIERLNLNPNDSIRDSYLELYLRKEYS